MDEQREKEQRKKIPKERKNAEMGRVDRGLGMNVGVDKERERETGRRK